MRIWNRYSREEIRDIILKTLENKEYGMSISEIAKEIEIKKFKPETYYQVLPISACTRLLCDHSKRVFSLMLQQHAPPLKFYNNRCVYLIVSK